MMQNRTEQATNKQFLRTIAENNYEVPDGVDNYDFARALLVNLGSPDGELRDELSYMILASGIIDKGNLTPDQMIDLLETVQDNNHLFFAIGEVNTNAVFMRSFSNLVIAAILYTDAKEAVFSEQVIQRTKLALLRYAEEEKDWRGYVEGKGWAHAMAHLADALDECAQHPAMTPQDRQDILQAIRRLAQLPEPLYHEEDMRLATSAQHIIVGRQVDDTFLNSWLASCFVQRGSDVTAWMSATNVKNFLRSLYFLLQWDNMLPTVSTQISDILKRLDDIYIQIADGR
ncbi:MAG: DUF2785 domain-containing protein [Ktedonobacteraceae bacterium]